MNIVVTRTFLLIFSCLLTLCSSMAVAIDVVKLLGPQSGFDNKEAHKDAVIKRALEITIPEYGAYEIEKTSQSAVTGRALKMMQDGELVNLCIRIANEEWNQKTIPIKLPLRFGVNSYRLLLTNKVDLPKFANIQTLEDLKKLRVGLGRDWTITNVFRVNGFQTVESSNFEGTFSMLAHRRFDYIPRGINEVFEELSKRKDNLDTVVIEPTLALELKLATYAYVAPNQPRLAKRLQSGLTMMLANGELRQLFNDYYLDEIKHAGMRNRKVIKIDNPLFVDSELLDDPKFWLSPNEL
ncbi:amino acid ABC transporter substrate-binding protein [Colwellia echini]|uniref:Amino acid ABC transporter substrate-binding protein n=1 Tax=Colwellia echini TaxID=1982103 RepID=A0ABY3MV07_9GAMM|nr:amino acid ABC transporter substrate-binding protein [Colwellia echini]TYK64961.1 amino acid ABC transporter substrate-binding protein [Colwellia echini]